MTLDLLLPDVSCTERLGIALAAHAPEALEVHLRGELGAGKSTLVRACLRALGHTGPVPSPTYTLVEAYRTERRAVQHLDLYRLADPEELEYIGWRDYVAEVAIRFIEWPERAAGFLGDPDLDVQLVLREEGRSVAIRSGSVVGTAVLRAVAAEWSEAGD